ncbi:thiamine biosynthesis protein ApbE [candidate division WOR-1 bacterium RIFOXYC2_FULL_37_10]|uniref:Thiamine biosynthesis protein ApbE n=1 Tax=candidate division WOR-1 bacterium RIFOXYB2_FULL_37_13 TaxID=1802579 RepID=A0A1F4ST51_UNCSA|nr:MAG: thiamine biosynthesis protein ApbE [candidate division WOR-1 bacterium RIFOXYA2_FULL_37_7]OGC23507.1 MAG: thiamine biosynthesis protein ApbE [candidate division WOR-1 bacterium RIFOXYB2_FULL_37_13]OGC37354.1 MAG: thiamine biosynthesis protein ApbE [candidate division WOR-1 bacterium RIFOXYC2_FULL_37_10]
MPYEERKYRKQFSAQGLVGFEVVEKETDLFIFADKDLTQEAKKSIFKYRKILEDYLLKDNNFEKSFTPLKVPLFAPQIIKEMAHAAKLANVGPMAAVAGAVAEFAGRDLLKHSKEIIVENGGDIFLKIDKPRKIGIFAGNSPLSNKLAIEIKPEDTPCGVCTSSGTVGHSFSFGKADAATIIAKSASLADAAATAVCNLVKTPDDIQKAVDAGKKIKGVLGILIIIEKKMGSWGKIHFVQKSSA